MKPFQAFSIKQNFPLGPMTTMGVGGPADYFAEIKTEEGLKKIYSEAQQAKIPVTVIGFGSNLIIGDKGVRGLVIRLDGDFAKLEIKDGNVFAGAAVRLPKLVTFAAEHGFSGMESLIGVPGAVGGSIVMNAGTREGEISRYLKEVRYLDAQRLEFVNRSREKIEFFYRGSTFQKIPAVICSGIFEFNVAKSTEEVLNTIEAFMRRRKETQPVNTKNAGSMFTNPEGDYAARMIEAAGLKGKRVGGAQISPVHANFISNLGGATASDIRSLMRLAQETVKQKFNIELHPEVHFMGEF